MKSINLVSYAKLNLHLKILGKRPDGYHWISTLFERISLSDEIKLTPRPDHKIKIVLSGLKQGIIQNNKNLAYQAAKALKNKCNIKNGAEILIKKRIPVAAGLGGGSSNAACVLSGLNRFWDLGLRQEELVDIGAKLGSDVPFFLYDCPFAFGSQRGEKIRILDFPLKLWHVIVVARRSLLSGRLYASWDRQSPGSKRIKEQKPKLTSPQAMFRILKEAAFKKDISLLGRLLYNSLEPVAEIDYPVIKKAKSAFSNLGAKLILMSGSGPAVFGIFSSRKEAYLTAERIKKIFAWDVFVVKTV